MDDNVLVHYGVLGMKWGVRRTPAQLARARGETSNSRSAKTSKKSSKTKKSASKTSDQKKKPMTDEELKAKISRLELEKRYKELASSVNPPPSRKGRDFVTKIIERSGENIATQFTTYVMGTAVNKLFGSIFDDDSIVNPKKGQKDK